jgi:undecaprenyl diphosphate synthase
VDTNLKTGTDLRVPKSIGIILDGNRRWAKENGLSSAEGHKKGSEKIEETFTWAREAGVQEVTFYVFSTENWKRSKEEVSFLMNLISDFFTTRLQDFAKEGIKVRFIGDRSQLSEKIQGHVRETEEQTRHGEKGTIVFALSYGGRLEILSAVNRLLEEKKEKVTEEEFKDAMWSAGLLDPDLIIRTGGDKRLSNFLTWQSTYSELFFTDTKWPALSKAEFISILEEYAQRERRHGK